MNLKKNTAKARLKKEKSKESISNEQKQICLNKTRDYILMGYTLMTGADIILHRAFELMSAVKPFLRYQDSWEIGECIKGLDGVIKRYGRTSVEMDSNVCNAFGMKGFDTIRSNANEVLRFIMLMYDRTVNNIENTEKVSQFLQSLESGGAFTDEEIADIKMR